MADLVEEARRQWLTHWGEAPAPSMAAVTSIMRAQQILMARLNALLKPLGLTFPRYEALMLLYLSRRGSLPLGKVGSRLQVHPTSVTNLIDGLEHAGLVRREPHEHDRRTTLAAITDTGRAVAEEATAILNGEVRDGPARNQRARAALRPAARASRERGRLRKLNPRRTPRWLCMAIPHAVLDAESACAAARIMTF